MRFINWKRILQGLTIWNQKISQYISAESTLKMNLFSKLFKKRLDNDFNFAWNIILYTNTTQNCWKTQSYVIFHSELFWRHSVKIKRDKLVVQRSKSAEHDNAVQQFLSARFVFPVPSGAQRSVYQIWTILQILQFEIECNRAVYNPPPVADG